MKKFIGLLGILCCLTSCDYSLDEEEPIRGVNLSVVNYTDTEYIGFTLLVGFEGEEGFIATDSLVSTDVIFYPGTIESPSWKERDAFIGENGFTENGTWLYKNSLGLGIGEEYFYIMKLENQTPFKSSAYLVGEGKGVTVRIRGEGKNDFHNSF